MQNDVPDGLSTLGLPNEKQRELMLGTWIAIGLIADTLIDAGMMRRADIVERLAEAEKLVTDERRRPLRVIRWFIEAPAGVRAAAQSRCIPEANAIDRLD